jgi:hypothetical protein
MALPFSVMILQKLGNTQKAFKSHVIKFLSVNLIVNPYKTQRKNYKNALYRNKYLIGTVHTFHVLELLKLKSL